MSEFDGEVCEPGDGWDLDLSPPPAPTRPPPVPELKMHGPDAQPPKVTTPGKSTPPVGPFTTDPKLATAAQEMRVGLAELAKLETKIIPALQRAAYQGETNMAHLEASSAVARIKKALATSDQLVPHRPGTFDDSPIATDRYKLRSGLNAVEDKLHYLMIAFKQRIAANQRAAADKAAFDKMPKGKPGVHYSKHAALPPKISFGKVRPGGTETEEWLIHNLVASPATITAVYHGDPAIRLVETAGSLAPMGQPSGKGLKFQFTAPSSKGTHSGTVYVTYSWGGTKLPAETFQIPVIAHSMLESDESSEDREAAAQARKTQIDDKARADKAAKDAAAQSERDHKMLEDFSNKHPDVETDRFREAVEHLQIEARKLQAKQVAGITKAENMVAKYKRRLPPKKANLWFELAMFALDIASAGIAGRIGKAMELGMAEAKVLEKLADGVYGPAREVAKWPNRAVISMFTDATKEAIKGGSKRLRQYTPSGGEHAADGKADQNRDSAYEFFAQQKVALADTSADREHGILEAAAALRPLVYQNEKAALEVLRIAEEKIRKEASGVGPMHDQMQQSLEAWVRFVAESSIDDKGTPNELHKIGDVRDYHEVKKLDGLIDISFKLGNKPTDPVIVTGARMLGVSDTVAAEFTKKPLLDYGVPVRAYGKGGANTNYAEILITVVRSSDGTLTLTEKDMTDYLSRKVYRRAGAAELGAKKLMEEEIMSKSLAQHGVTLKHDHDNG